MIIDLLAWSGALISCLLSLPQLLQALHSERLEGLSAATYWLVLGNAAIWAAWAVLAGEYAAGVPALINGPAAVVIIVRIHQVGSARSRHDGPNRLSQRSPVGGCEGAGGGPALSTGVGPMSAVSR